MYAFRRQTGHSRASAAPLRGALSVNLLEGRIAPAVSEFLDPNPNPGNQFGQTVLPLSTGNVVITSPYDDFGGIDAGAVYLFNGKTGALISTLRGSSANHNVGSNGAVALSNGNYVVISANWDNGVVENVGAVTFGNGVTGVDGQVSAANSLVGAATSDSVGSPGITPLTNGNYVVVSSFWSNGSVTRAGVVTFGNGMTGVNGLVSATNSLIGGSSLDYVGNGGVTALNNGNYVVRSSNWDNVGATDAGAVTFGNGSTGVSGQVSATTSLVGGKGNDSIGSGGVTTLSNGNYVVASPYWHNNSGATVGAATLERVSNIFAGLVTETNSLVGSKTGDFLYVGVTALTNSNYVVNNPYWGGSTVGTGDTGQGAVTFGKGDVGVVGKISAVNSLVGMDSDDEVGISVTALSNGNYVVHSPKWTNQGAITFGSGNTGIVGPVSASNSLIGGTASNNYGNSTVTNLANGNYIVASPFWRNGTVSSAGAVTFCNGNTGLAGTISPVNSLVGTQQMDQVGKNLIALANGNFVVGSPFWDNGTTMNAGAVTFCSGVVGVIGTVSASNSLIGATANDQVGSNVVALTNGNFVANSPTWDHATLVDVGAVTFGNGITGISGVVNTVNSLVGTTANERIGTNVLSLANGNYVVISPNWNSGAATTVGAVTFGDGMFGVSGKITEANSLVGGQTDDQVGFGGVTALSNGNYVVRSPLWDNGATVNAGALTFGNGATGVIGLIATANSAIGMAANTNLQATIVDKQNGTFFGRFLNENNGRVRVGSQIHGFTAPRVVTVSVNEGAAQRSRVTSVSVTFDQIVATSAIPAAAFELVRPSDSALPALSASLDNSGTGTVVTLTFSGTNAVEFGSLADGRYTLTIDANQVLSSNGNLDGNGDGIPGDDYVLASSGTAGIYRLFGDSDGDGSVGINDLNQIRLSFGGSSVIFDLNGDGSVSGSDFGQFRVRFGGSV